MLPKTLWLGSIQIRRSCHRLALQCSFRISAIRAKRSISISGMTGSQTKLTFAALVGVSAFARLAVSNARKGCRACPTLVARLILDVCHYWLAQPDFVGAVHWCVLPTHGNLGHRGTAETRRRPDCARSMVIYIEGVS